MHFTVTSTCSKLTNRWLFDGTSASTSGSTVIDSIGTLNGTASAGGYSYSNGAISFNGVSGNVDFGSLVFGGALSVAFWAKLNTITNWVRFIDWANGSPGDNIAFVTSYNGYLSILVSIGTNAAVLKTSSYTVTSGVWSHYAVTFDSSGNFVVYVNGASVYSDSFGSAIPTTTRTHLYLGKSWWSADPYLNGAMKDFQLAAGTTLSLYDVQYLYKNVCPVPAGSSSFQ